MADTKKVVIPSTLYVCTACDFSKQENGYQTVSVKQGQQVPVCPKCGKALIAEDEQHRFRRLARKRVVNALKSLRLLGNMSTAAYDYAGREDDVRKVVNLIDAKWGEHKGRLMHVHAIKAVDTVTF